MNEEYQEYIKSNSTVDDNGCWIWKGSISGKGYGNGRRLNECKWMHRNSHTVFKGDIGFYNVVRHICDNPPCVNPDHLVACSQSENIKDALTKGRMSINIHRTGNKEIYDRILSLWNEGKYTIAFIARQVNMSHRQTKRIIEGEFYHEPVSHV